MAVLLASLRVGAALGLIVPLLLTVSIANWLLACAIALLLAGSFVRWAFLLFIAEPHFIAPTPGLRVAVVTSFVPSAESLPMLERTLTAMQKIRYPHDTWLLDEGDDDAAIELCGRLGVRHFSRKGRPEYLTEHGQFQRGTKHGNYNAWLNETGFADVRRTGSYRSRSCAGLELFDRDTRSVIGPAHCLRPVAAGVLQLTGIADRTRL